MCITIYVYIYICMLSPLLHLCPPLRTRRDLFTLFLPQPTLTVGFHNFNLRIVNLRVSNPNKLTVIIFYDTMSDFNVLGSRPKKTRSNFGNRPYTSVHPCAPVATSLHHSCHILPCQPIL